MSIDLRQGDWRDVLADVDSVDAVITDPPYGARNHAGVRVGTNDGDRACSVTEVGLGYAHWTPDDVHEFVAAWSPRTDGWMACQTSHDLIPAYEEAYRAAGRYAFAPVPCGMRGMNCRMMGDGPSSWAVYLMVARPRERRFLGWGTLPGFYVGPRRVHDRGRSGGKPPWLMRAIVRDYSRPGDLVCDPCAGYGTTLRAAVAEGRRAVGAEIDAETWSKAMGLKVAGDPRQAPLFGEVANG